MSSYTHKYLHPKTGKEQLAYCIDDYYGPHIYGYGFAKDGSDADWTKKVNFEKDYDFFRWEDVKKAMIKE